MKYKLFEYQYSKGNIDVYKPNKDLDIYILAIDIFTGRVAYKKIKEYSIHKDLTMYRIHDTKNRFQDFWASSDHSLIVWNNFKEVYEKVSPLDILNKPANFCLIKQNKDYDKFGDSKEFIPCDEIEIAYDPNVTEAGDFEVEDYYTFSTHDGVFVQDTMAVYTPLSQEALEDTKKLSNILHPANPRKVEIQFTKELSGGICILTMDPVDKYSNQYKWWKKIKFQNVWTTEGRVSIWNVLPKKAKDIFDFEKDFNKKINIEFILQRMVIQEIDQEEIIDFAWKVQNLSLDTITKASESLDLKMFEISDKVKHLIDKLDDTKTPIEKQEILNKINNAVLAYLSKTDIALLLECGTLKKNQLFQLLGSKGLMMSPTGDIILVKSNFAKGLKPTEFFSASYGARKGIIDRTNKTAITGYLMRKLIYGLASVNLDPENEFCGTTKQLRLTLDSELIQRVINRYVIFDNKLVKITPQNMNDFIGQEVLLYSPIYCKSKNICVRCFGDDFKLLNSTSIGTLAAQSLGERLTQEMLKSFHTGGIVKPFYIDFYQNVSENTNIKPEVLHKYFEENKIHEFFAKEKLKFIFSKEDEYNFNLFIKDMEDSLQLNYLISEVYVNNDKIDVVFDGTTIFYLPDSIEFDKKKYTLVYNQGSLIFKVMPEVNDMEIISKRIQSTVEGRAKIKDEHHLLMKLLRDIKPMGVINLNWLEILISQLMRYKKNPSIPARLGETWDPQIISIKQIPYVESWVRGLEFENFGKSISNALAYPDVTMKSKLDELII